MKHQVTSIIKSMIIMIAVSLISLTLSAQDNSDYENAKNEIKETFGMFPSMFKVFPKHALPGAWENFKQLNGPNNIIPPKYRELIQLAVAAQIPCDY
jgi:alkylhydroperoxidase/carboxymuconolactone decarboxylase family protein YurZ